MNPQIETEVKCFSSWVAQGTYVTSRNLGLSVNYASELIPKRAETIALGNGLVLFIFKLIEACLT